MNKFLLIFSLLTISVFSQSEVVPVRIVDADGIPTNTVIVSSTNAFTAVGGAIRQTLTTDSVEVNAVGTTWCTITVFADNDSLQISQYSSFASPRLVLPYGVAGFYRFNPVTFPKVYIKRYKSSWISGESSSITFDWSAEGN